MSTTEATVTADDPKILRTVITASAVGTVIEWYDFYLFGVMATIIAGQFFPKDNPTAGYLLTLATFATGFVIRPFGAIVFGRLGDLVGRKTTFLITLLMMGASTFLVGCLPSYAAVGVLAPLLLVLLRLVQGLALGGEYGGAATYVAEHCPQDKRGYYTSFIQITATGGLILALVVILGISSLTGKDGFESWGWRIPFMLSAILIGVSTVIRLRMSESPMFAKLKSEGKQSVNPLKESFGNPANLRLVLIALFGATAGQGVVWYTGQFYAQSFMLKTLNLPFDEVNKTLAVALLCAVPFFIVFGKLSDRIGRKQLIVAGCILGAVAWIPIFHAMTSAAGFDPITKKSIDPNYFMLGFLIWLQAIFVTIVYGPIAAFLVEMFPTRIRYTSMSLPYHIGNGVFGGLVPFLATAVVTKTGNIYAGLYYPIAIALITAVVGSLFIKDRHGLALDHED